MGPVQSLVQVAQLGQPMPALLSPQALAAGPLTAQELPKAALVHNDSGNGYSEARGGDGDDSDGDQEWRDRGKLGLGRGQKVPVTKVSFQCVHCAFNGASEQQIIRHCEEHVDAQGQALCPLCAARFPSVDDLRTHLKGDHIAKSFVCPSCGKGFGNKASLVQHMAVHSDVKPFKCPHCDYASVRNGDLKKHLRFHYNQGRSRQPNSDSQ